MEVTEKDENVQQEVADDSAAAPAEAPATDSQDAESPTDSPANDVDPAQNRPLLVDIPIQNENVALNVLVGFLNLAQRRGSFNFKESAKIGECIEMFVQGPQSQ